MKKTTTPASQRSVGPVVLAADQSHTPFTSEISADLAAFYRAIEDPDELLKQDSDGYKKLYKEWRIGQALRHRRQLVAGRGWLLEPASDGEDDAKVVSILTDVLKLCHRFTATRYALADAFLRGMAVCRIDGDFVVRALGGFDARRWWVPSLLPMMDKRRFRLEPTKIQHRDATGKFTAEAHIEWNWSVCDFERPSGEQWIRLEQPEDYIWHRYEEGEEHLGYGGGLGSALRLLLYGKTKLIKHVFQGAERWGHGMLHVGSTFQSGPGGTIPASETTKWVNALKIMMSRHVLIHDKQDELSLLESNFAGADLMLRVIQYLDDCAVSLILNANLPTSAAKGGSYSLAEVQADSTEATIAFDRALLDESLTSGLIARLYALNLSGFTALGLKPTGMPQFRTRLPETRDVQVVLQNAQALRQALEMGMPVKRQEAYSLLRLTQPAKDDEVLTPEDLVAPPVAPGVEGGLPFSAAPMEVYEVDAEPDVGPLLTVHEAAARLRVSAGTVRGWIRAGRLRGGRIGAGGPVRVPEAALREVTAFGQERRAYAALPAPGRARSGIGDALGVFLRVPREAGFPAIEGTPAHATLLYVGEREPEDLTRLVDAVRVVAVESEPFGVRAEDYDEFTNDEGQTIAHVVPRTDPRWALERLHGALRRAAEAIGLAPEHHDGLFVPHITLAYVDPDAAYDGPRPTARWRAEAVEVWGFGRVVRVPLGGGVFRFTEDDEMAVRQAQMAEIFRMNLRQYSSKKWPERTGEQEAEEVYAGTSGAIETALQAFAKVLARHEAHPGGALEQDLDEPTAALFRALAETLAIADLLGRRRTVLDARAPRQYAAPVGGFKYVSFEEALTDLVKRGIFSKKPEEIAWEFGTRYGVPVPRYGVHPAPEPLTAALIRERYAATPTFAALLAADKTVTTQVRDRVAQAVRSGEGEEAAAKAIAEMADWTRAYARNVYRTNVMGAYAAGRFAQAQDPDTAGFVAGFEFQAVMDADTRPNHAACDGARAPADDPLWGGLTPPLGYQCRCSLRTITTAEAERNGWLGPDGRLKVKGPRAGGGPDMASFGRRP